jgi:hypothetical protein
MDLPVSLSMLEMKAYEQRLVVNRIRREMYQVENPSISEKNFDDLQGAETVLSQIEAKLAEITAKDESSGRLLDTRKKSDVLGAETTGLEAQVFLRMEQIPTSIYHLFDKTRNPLLSVEVRNIPKDKNNPIRRVRVTSFIDGYSVAEVTTLELEPKKTYSFDQLPALIPERLKDLTELTRASLNVLVEDLDTQKVEIHNTYPVWMLARTTAPLAVKDPKTGQIQDFTPYLGCFVTPNEQSVMKFLRAAVDLHPEKSLVGYQQDPSKVAPQVKALYEALKSVAGITYVNSVVDFTPKPDMMNQRIRLPRESLEEKEANCIDGTVLFASLLEAITLSPAIVLVPGHAFLAWETWSGSPGDWCFVETTMIGYQPFETACAFAEQNAKRWMSQLETTKDPRFFRLLPLSDLRVKLSIYPME